MDGATEQAQRAGSGRDRAVRMQSSPWHGPVVLVALMPAAFTFNTAENLPVGLLELISESLRVSVPTVGLLVTGYVVVAPGRRKAARDRDEVRHGGVGSRPGGALGAQVGPQ